MADHIKVSTEEMRAAIAKYNEARNILEEAYGQIEAARDHLDNCYKGPAYVALRAKLGNIYGNVKSADFAITETMTGLSKTIDTMERTENEENRGVISQQEEGSTSPVYL